MPDAGRPEGLLATIQRLSFARDLQAITDAVRSEVRQLTGADGVTFVLVTGTSVTTSPRMPSDRCGRASVSRWSPASRAGS